MGAVEWMMKPFAGLSTQQLYAVLRLRTDVFVVEQRCAYPELDDIDAKALHLFAMEEGRALAYLRIYRRPGKEGWTQIGRVVTARTVRGRGLGRQLMERALAAIAQRGGGPVYLEAQCQARGFYEALGFAEASQPFLEDGIPHLAMTRTVPAAPRAPGPAPVLYILAGPMGVGKSTAARALEHLLPACAMLDGDWCWHMDPWNATPAARAMVLDNIGHTLTGMLSCDTFEHVVFCWVMHQADIWRQVRARLAPAAEAYGWQIKACSLTCTPEALTARMEGDGRSPQDIRRSLEYLKAYPALGAPVLDTTHLTPEATARALWKGSVTGWPV